MGLISVVCSTVKLCVYRRLMLPLERSNRCHSHSELDVILLPQNLYFLTARLPYTVSELYCLILLQSCTALYCLRARLPYTDSELC